MRAWRWSIPVSAWIVVVASCGPSSEPPAKKPPQPASKAPVTPAAVTPKGTEAGKEEPKAEPRGPVGWYAVYTPTTGDAVKTSSAYAAFALGDGKSIHPGVQPEGLVAAYSGEVTIDAPGRYRFAAQMQGGLAKLSVVRGVSSVAEAALTPDQSAVQTAFVDLPLGTVTVNVSFTRIGAGPAVLRTMWEKEGAGEKAFREEPIPPRAVTVARYGINDAASAASALHGRILLGELNCTSCHDAGAASSVILARQAPLMGEIGRRASAEWLTKWINDPQAVKPGCGMPRVIGDASKDKADADALVHYLLSLGSAPEWQAAASESHIVDEGRKLYHTVGCVACHGVLDDPGKIFTDAGAVTGAEHTPPPAPFGRMSGKWRAAGLSEFLKDPLRTRPGGRMPSLSLNSSEADLIATYLVNSWDSGGFKPAEFKPDPAKVEVGRGVFASRGCASCHQTGHGLPDIATTLKAKALADLTPGAGCLDPKSTTAPRYTLSEGDRADIAAGLAEIKKMGASPAPAPIDVGYRVYAALGCANCHQKNESGGIPDDLRVCCRTLDETELGDEGRIPPRLTGVGAKLNTPWMKKVLTDGGRARPYMATRMPQFGSKIVGDLAEQLALMDGVVPDSDIKAPPANDSLVLAGRKLVGEKGMNCISCHVFAGKAAGTQGPDITGFAQRLRLEWFRPYLMAPTRYKPGTRMTAFYATGKGAVTDVFGGDPDRQADALWSYFAASAGGPAPEGLPMQSGLPLIVGDKPVIFRTFLKDAASRGIAVGYPIGTHFGFDATGVRLSSAWRGEFIDATSAWKSRGGMVATGQGKSIWTAPAGPALVIGDRPESWPDKTGAEAGYRFHGYRVGDKGVPVFMYSVGKAEVEEVFEPVENGQIRRTFTVKNIPAGATVWLNTGPGVVASNAIANIGSDRAAGDGKVKLEAYTPKESGQPMSFAVVIKP